jgi:hypothetical protein
VSVLILTNNVRPRPVANMLTRSFAFCTALLLAGAAYQ